MLLEYHQEEFESTFTVDLDDNQKLLPENAAWTDASGQAWRSELWYLIVKLCRDFAKIESNSC